MTISYSTFPDNFPISGANNQFLRSDTFSENNVKTLVDAINHLIIFFIA